MKKTIRASIEAEAAAHRNANAAVGRGDEGEYITAEFIQELEAEMLAAAESLEFERVAQIRDRITRMRDAVGERKSDHEKIGKGIGGGKRGRATKGRAKVPRPKRG